MLNGELPQKVKTWTDFYLIVEKEGLLHSHKTIKNVFYHEDGSVTESHYTIDYIKSRAFDELINMSKEFTFSELQTMLMALMRFRNVPDDYAPLIDKIRDRINKRVKLNQFDQ